MEGQKYRDLFWEGITRWAIDFKRRFRMSGGIFSIRVFLYALDILLSYSVFIRDPVFFAEREVNPFAVGTLRGEPFSILGFLGLLFLYLLVFVYIVSYSKETTQRYQRYLLIAYTIIVLLNGLIAPLGWFWPILTLVWAILYRVELFLLLFGILFGSSKKITKK